MCCQKASCASAATACSSNRFRKQLLPLARTLLAAQGREPLPLPPLPDCAPWHCPRCGKAMRVVERFTAAELYFAGFDSS